MSIEPGAASIIQQSVAEAVAAERERCAWEAAAMPEVPHTPWFIRPRPLDNGLAVIENGTEEGSHIAECEWHIAEEIVKAMNHFHQQPD